jgi:Leucine-rich repeat (LRR) protein
LFFFRASKQQLAMATASSFLSSGDHSDLTMRVLTNVARRVGYGKYTLVCRVWAKLLPEHDVVLVRRGWNMVEAGRFLDELERFRDVKELQMSLDFDVWSLAVTEDQGEGQRYTDVLKMILQKVPNLEILEVLCSMNTTEIEFNDDNLAELFRICTKIKEIRVHDASRCTVLPRFGAVHPFLEVLKFGKLESWKESSFEGFEVVYRHGLQELKHVELALNSNHAVRVLLETATMLKTLALKLGSRVTRLPEQSFPFPQLEKIHLVFARLPNINAFEQALNLRVAIIIGNIELGIGWTFGNFQVLRTVTIESSFLVAVPEVIETWGGLRALTLQCPNVSEVVDGFSFPGGLRKLVVSSLRCFQPQHLQHIAEICLWLSDDVVPVAWTNSNDMLLLQVLEVDSCEKLDSIEGILMCSPRLQTLKVRNCRALRSLGGDMGRLAALEKIVVSSSPQFRLPADIHLLRALQHLTLDEYGGELLPSTFTSLPNLESLVVIKGSLIELPGFIGQMNAHLKKIVLSHVDWTSVPASLDDIKSVHYINCPGLSYIEC